jgi:hypothetical protein
MKQHLSFDKHYDISLGWSVGIMCLVALVSLFMLPRAPEVAQTILIVGLVIFALLAALFDRA